MNWSTSDATKVDSGRSDSGTYDLSADLAALASFLAWCLRRRRARAAEWGCYIGPRRRRALTSSAWPAAHSGGAQAAGGRGTGRATWAGKQA